MTEINNLTNDEISAIKSLDELLIRCKKSKMGKPTHTRIGNAKKNVFGGAYCLDFSNKKMMNKFYKFYNRKVLKKISTNTSLKFKIKKMAGLF